MSFLIVPPLCALEIIRKDFLWIKSLSRLLKVIQGQSAISFIQALLYRIMYLFPNLNDIFSHNPITFTYCSWIFISSFMYMTLDVIEIGGNTYTKGKFRWKWWKFCSWKVLNELGKAQSWLSVWKKLSNFNENFRTWHISISYWTSELLNFSNATFKLRKNFLISETSFQLRIFQHKFFQILDLSPFTSQLYINL